MEMKTTAKEWMLNFKTISRKKTWRKFEKTLKTYNKKTHFHLSYEIKTWRKKLGELDHNQKDNNIRKTKMPVKATKTRQIKANPILFQNFQPE